MKLFTFLGTAKNIDKIKLVDGWSDSNKPIWEGSYGEGSKAIYDLNLENAIVLSWEVDGNLVIIGIDTN